MAPPIITPDTFNTPLYHYLVVLKNLADDFVSQGYKKAPISVVQLPSPDPHASGTGFFDPASGKSTNPTIAAFLCPSGILTAPASSFGMDYIRLFPGQSSSITIHPSAIPASSFSGSTIASSFASQLPSSGLNFRYHILSGANSENYYIYEEYPSARNINVSRSWTISNFDYFVGIYSKVNQKISNFVIRGDYYVTSGNSGPMLSYHYLLNSNYQTKNIYLPVSVNYQSSSNFLDNPTMIYVDVSSSNGLPQNLGSYYRGETVMKARDYESVADYDYVFASKNIGVTMPQYINTVRANAYLDGVIYLNQTIPNFVSTTFMVGGDSVIFSGGGGSHTNLPNVQLSGAGLALERSLLSMMNNYLLNFNESKKINDAINTELNLKNNLYISIVTELLKLTGAKNFLDKLS